MDLTGAVALVFFFGTIGVVIGGWILARHRERMSIIDKGIAAEDVKALYQRGTWRANPLSSLKWGILFIAVGVAVLAGIWMQEVYHTPDGVMVGVLALFCGVGLVLFHVMARRKAEMR